jgi:hypothetical protein
VPSDVVRSFRAFLEFCYIARSDIITEQTLETLEAALVCFHRYRTVFQAMGVRLDISLPRQHSMTHYAMLIRLFGAPNGLCSSITESKHIKAVKEPWRRSNRYQALLQMLNTNQRLDKLTAGRADFQIRDMFDDTILDSVARIQGTSLVSSNRIIAHSFSLGVPTGHETTNTTNSVDDETNSQSQPPAAINNPLRVRESDVTLGSRPHKHQLWSRPQTELTSISKNDGARLMSPCCPSNSTCPTFLTSSVDFSVSNWTITVLMKNQTTHVQGF